MSRGSSWRGYAALVSAVLLLLAAVTLPTGARAQQLPSRAQDRVQLLQPHVGLRDDAESQATGTDDTHAVASPNDPDLGEQAILRRSEHYRPFTISVAAPFSYTSNVALTSAGEEGDAIFTPAFVATYAPRITRTLYANFSLGQQFFFYDRFSELNFGSFDARAGLTYVLPQWHNLVLRANYGFNRLTDDDFDQFFASHTIMLGAEMPFRIGRAQVITIGTELDFLIATDPNPPGRNDFSGYVAYQVNMTRDLTLNAVGRLAVRDYVDVDRTDVSGIFSVGASYRFNKWLSANAGATFATSDSNQDVFDYNVFDVGGAVALVFRF